MSGKWKMNEVNYIGSYVDWKNCPTDELPQYAFVGRSNVGKSSLINMLAGRKKIAFTSKSPGKTQTINFYEVDNTWYLVDLPGYGYAKTSKKNRRKWYSMIHQYLKNSASLACVFVLLDSRIGPQKNDMKFINELGKNQVPLALIYTKTDKVKRGKLNKNIRKIQDEILNSWEHLPDEFISSSVTKEGREDILAFIYELNKNL